MAFLATLAKVAKSRTVWGAVAAGGLFVGQAAPTIAQYVPPGGKLSVILGLAATAFTIYGRIRAKQPLGPVIDQTIAQTVEAVHVIGSGQRAESTTTIVNPTSVAGKVMQIAEVTSVVKAIAAQPLDRAGAAEHVE